MQCQVKPCGELHSHEVADSRHVECNSGAMPHRQNTTRERTNPTFRTLFARHKSVNMQIRTFHRAIPGSSGQHESVGTTDLDWQTH